MTRAGRFLWLDWDQAEIVQLEPDRVIVERNGYRKIGLRHRRSVRWFGPGEWQVQDELLPVHPNGSVHTSILHWLLPDGDWELTGGRLLIKRPKVCIRVEFSCPGVSPEQTSIQLIRAGTLVYGQGGFPATAGWFSPTYAEKQPALAFRFAVTKPAPLTFLTILQALDNP
jgi:hypothetical protein